MAAKRKDAELYGQGRPKKAKTVETSNSLSFSSQLASLISSSGSSKSEKATKASGRFGPKKDDIFSVHNKNAKKRALKDLEDAKLEQKHSTSGESLDQDIWRLSQRKMEDKARLYAAMKRGDLEDENEKYAVDFDRKWAETEGQEDSDISSDDEEDEPEELIEYVDEFGRNRTGTRAQVAREESRRNRVAKAADDLPDDRFTARPNMPTNIIYGNTIQAAAFNPDEDISQKQADLAAKRDKSLTPPPDEHFDSRKEFRTKGVGFFQFSLDKDERSRQMDELEKQRIETEKKRAELDEKEAQRKREIEAQEAARKKEYEIRKRKIAEKRNKARTDKFLDDFAQELEDKPADG
jgi:hypothetical protein